MADYRLDYAGLTTLRMPGTKKYTCHICSSDHLELIEEYEAFYRVTSDCKPWTKGGALGLCHECQLIQAIITEQWLDEVERIYQQYDIYAQGLGEEQLVFDVSSGVASGRSALLVERLLASVPLPRKGRLLDIGCGNGAFFRSFGHRLSDWRMVGTETNEKRKSDVESIRGVEACYTGSLARVPGGYHMVSMIHVLEHIPRPGEFLRSLQDRIRDGGFLFVQLPDYVTNPFELMIADHGTHFSLESAQRLISASGYEVFCATTDWVPKEISIIGRKRNGTHDPKTHLGSTYRASKPQLEARLNWLSQIIDEIRKLIGKDKIGIFGTSIAASWIFGNFHKEISFFVDEDVNRIGRHYLGLPVHSPAQIPRGSTVFLAFTPSVANSVLKRLNLPWVNFVLPPEIFESVVSC